MPNSFQIVSSRLLVTNVSIDTSISCCACQVLSLSERNMLSLGVLIALGKTEINDEDVVLIVLISPNQEVIWLNVSVNNPLLMYLLDSLNLK